MPTPQSTPLGDKAEAPPTTNVRVVDDACRFRLVQGKALGTTLEYAMTNSFGFGGTNASLIFRAPTH
jgi:3-oxoacyl-[acyl-carrier-protein] synthase II